MALLPFRHCMHSVVIVRQNSDGEGNYIHGSALEVFSV